MAPDEYPPGTQENRMLAGDIASTLFTIGIAAGTISSLPHRLGPPNASHEVE